ncbi:MAG: isopentenyl phosphate kinase [Anaerolineae bacterium]
MRTVFLKLGGSLITDKYTSLTPRPDVIQRLAQECAAGLAQAPDLRLLLGHGSGSFGHMAARRYQTRAGVTTAADWRGFAEVSRVAAQLNRLVADAFGAAGVPVWSLAPSASALCRDGELLTLADRSVSTALRQGLTPLVYGDVALDEVRGGTIVSTEEVFDWLARRLRPDFILLAGMVGGVYDRDPLADASAQPVPLISAADLTPVADGLGGSHGADVTGGMASKVRVMSNLVQALPGLQVRFFSGEQPGAVTRLLLQPELPIGTLLR